MRLLKRAIRRLLDPLIRIVQRFFDHRFRATEDRIVERVGGIAAAGSGSPQIPELLAHLGQRLRQLAEETSVQAGRLDAIETMLRGSALDMSPGTGPVLEAPYAFAALAELNRDSRILIVGGGANALGLSLASFGFQVTQVGGRRAHVKNVRLELVEGRFEAWTAPPFRFDGIVLSSAISMGQLDSLAARKAILVVTAPFGRAAFETSPPIPHLAALDGMLRGWAVHDLRFGVLTEGAEWTVEEGRERAAWIEESGAPAVVLATARRDTVRPHVDD